MLRSIDIWIEERATARIFLGFQIVFILAINMIFEHNNSGTELQQSPFSFGNDECDLSNSIAYFGSMCAILAACMAPLLDLVLELIESRRSKGDKSSVQLPYNSFLMERSVVLIALLTPSIIYIQDISHSSCHAARENGYYQDLITGSTIIAILRALNPVLLTWKTMAGIFLIFDARITCRLLYGTNNIWMWGTSGVLVLCMSFFLIRVLILQWNDTGADLQVSFKNTAAFWYTVFGITYFMVARIILGYLITVHDTHAVLISGNLMRVGFITVFFVMGSPRRLGMDLFVLKAS